MIAYTIYDPYEFYTEYWLHYQTCSGAIKYTYSDFVIFKQAHPVAWEVAPDLANNISAGNVCCYRQMGEWNMTFCEELWINK